MAAAAQDADSLGGEGAFFTWTPDEITAVLDPADVEGALARFGVTDHGNFEGRTILHVADPAHDVMGRDLVRVLQACGFDQLLECFERDLVKVEHAHRQRMLHAHGERGQIHHGQALGDGL